MPRRFPLLALLALAAALVAPAALAAPADPFRLALFSSIDREAVEIGGLVQVDLEVLAVPQSAEAEAALRAALEAWDVAGQLGAAFQVVRMTPLMERRTDEVVEMQRRLILRVQRPAAEIPPLRLTVPLAGATWTFGTRAHRLQTFEARAEAREAGASVLAVTAEGLVDGVRYERMGSAWLVGGDALVTAYHVVVGARSVRVTLPDGEARIGEVWALDPERDVAVLHLPAERVRAAGLRPLVVAPERSAGAVAFTMGWPDRQRQETVAARFDDLVLGGQRLRVSGNAVRPGDSGGPLLDEAGRVLGVVVSGRGTFGQRDLLRAPICMASDPGPALTQYQAAERPVPLRRALADAAAALPSARAHEAAGAIGVPVRRQGADRRPHLALLRDALREAPRDPVLLYLAGTVLEEMGEERLAAGAFQAAHQAGHVPAGYSLAHHLLGAGRFRLAADLFAEAAADGAYRQLGALGQAQALVGMGRYAEAEAPLLAVLDHDARFAPALYLLGVVRLAQGREAEARALAVRLRSRPGWAGALDGPIRQEALRPPRLRPLPRVALR